MYAYHARGHILMNQILGITRHGSLEMKIAQRIPEDSFSNIRNCIGIARGFMHDLSSVKKGNASLEVVLLSVPDGYHCVDLCLYKESQIVLLLNESTTSSESSSNGCMMIVQASALPFVSISRSTGLNCWNLHELKVKLCNKEGLKASSIALTALAEYTVGDQFSDGLPEGHLKKCF
ncbi:anaphase-promoting complex subunit 4-like [Camellia sinensis]|uniref:anaphase-promoting complex subunit 4-like n=1 Tax=Camellia sinensis TaxID=4442 RepID=UPI0010362A42|nr:anaphase-promoting complex subunit 4-like [Camellia sinensis]